MNSKYAIFAASLAASVTLALALNPSQAQPDPRRGTASAFAPASTTATLANVGTEFTYQGRLTSGGAPVNSACDFQFSLWDAASGGAQVGSTQTHLNVSVSAGYFTVSNLDFGGSAFDGQARWLAVSVRCPAGSGSYTALSPRQPLTAAPYAHSLRPGAIVAGDVNGQAAFYASNAATSGGSVGVRGSSDSTSGYGVAGVATATSGVAIGIYGESASTAGRGVFGRATATGGLAYGVYGHSSSSDGVGVFGQATATSGLTYGVHGASDSTTGRGVLGEALAVSGFAYGVVGRSASTDGIGVYGAATASSGMTYGVYGQSSSPSGRGVFGQALATSGTTYGVQGESASPTGSGVHGVATATSGNTKGIFGSSVSPSGDGVYGEATSTSGAGYGVFGRSNSTGGIGVYGFAAATSGTNYGVYGLTNSPNGYAGYFNGQVQVTGNLSKGSGSFLIDHPLDPANKYLYHSFVESPDMKNIYDGVVTLDANGEAWVHLPAWFEALNMDFRYQLTPIGASMPGLYVAQKIQNNRFKIAGGLPNMEVSWQVTGIRNDPYARMYRIPVEVDKPAEERGTYLHPEAHGQPKTRGLDYQRNSAMRETHEHAPGGNR